MRYKTFKTVKTVKETIDIETGEVLEVQTLHHDTNLKSILRDMGFLFDKSGNNPFYSKVLRLKKKGLPLHEVFHTILLEDA
jgi:hypothetical protein